MQKFTDMQKITDLQKKRWENGRKTVTRKKYPEEAAKETTTTGYVHQRNYNESVK